MTAWDPGDDKSNLEQHGLEEEEEYENYKKKKSEESIGYIKTAAINCR